MANLIISGNRKGQAEIMDGLILLIITSICSIALLGISGSYGRDALLEYDTIYKQKVAQSALLSLYHITDREKSVMAYVSQDIAKAVESGDAMSLPNIRTKIKNTLDYYYGRTGWDFGFAIIDEPSGMAVPESYITSSDRLTDAAKFRDYPKVCASAALTYPESSGTMKYQLFQVCVWSRD